MNEPAKPFEEMVADIIRVDPEKFAGAVVVVPPGDGEPIAFLTTDPKPNIVQFWSTVKNRIDVAANEAIQAAATRDPWQR